MLCMSENKMMIMMIQKVTIAKMYTYEIEKWYGERKSPMGSIAKEGILVGDLSV